MPEILWKAYIDFEVEELYAFMFYFNKAVVGWVVV